MALSIHYLLLLVSDTDPRGGQKVTGSTYAPGPRDGREAGQGRTGPGRSGLGSACSRSEFLGLQQHMTHCTVQRLR